MILSEWDAPEGDPGQSCVHLFARILSTSFSSVSIFSVCCYSIVSISMIMTHPPPPPPHRVYSLSRYFGSKVQLGPANRRQKLGLVWRNRKKICQIINDCLCLPFFLLIILCIIHYISGNQDSQPISPVATGRTLST